MTRTKKFSTRRPLEIKIKVQLQRPFAESKLIAGGLYAIRKLYDHCPDYFYLAGENETRMQGNFVTQALRGVST